MRINPIVLTAFLSFSGILPVEGNTDEDTGMATTTAFNTAAGGTAAAQAAKIIEKNPTLEPYRSKITAAFEVLCEHQGNTWTTVHENKWKWMESGNFHDAVRTFKTSSWGKRAPAQAQEFESALGELATLTGRPTTSATRTHTPETQQTSTPDDMAANQTEALISINPALATHRASLNSALSILCKYQDPHWNIVHKNKWAMMQRGDFAQAVRTFKTSKWGERAPEEVARLEAALAPILNDTNLGHSTNRAQTPTRAAFRENADTIAMTANDEYLCERFLKHLLDREGYRNDVYMDSEGKLTVGVGHLVLPEDNLNLNDRISDEAVYAFLEKDSERVLRAAKSQAAELGVQHDPDLVLALASVNYQLGTGWRSEHKKTWSLMKEGRLAEAAAEAAKSEWNKQTPVRAHDFQDALRDAATMTAPLPSI